MTLPLESIRMRSDPAVEVAITSAAGNQNPVFKSPLWAMEGVVTAPSPKLAIVFTVSRASGLDVPIPTLFPEGFIASGLELQL